MKSKYNNLYKKDTFNILIIISTIFYCISFFTVFSNQTKKNAAYEELFETLFYQTNEYNSNVLMENNTTPQVEKEIPIFFNAKEAVATAYEKWSEAVSYEFYSIGTINTNVSIPGGMNVQIDVNANAARFANGNNIMETKRYEEGNSNGQTKSTFDYFTSNGKYQKSTTNVKKNSDNTLSATYSSGFVLQPNNNDKPVNIIVNRSTISKELFFRINYDLSGKINNYSASVNLNTTTAVMGGYSQFIKSEGGLGEMPKFSKLEVNCIIDSEGNLVSMKLLETYTSSKVMVVSIGITCNNNFNYFFSNMNKTPSIPEPRV